MGFSSSLDLDELFSYFLSGSVFIAIFAIGHPDTVNTLLDLAKPLSGTPIATIMQSVLFLGLSLNLGHVFSVLVRTFQRRLINSVLGDPRQAIFPIIGSGLKRRAAPEFFNKEFRQAVANKFESVFKKKPSELPALSLPRLIRSYVFHNSESAIGIRERIVRARSFCANMAISLTTASIFNFCALTLEIHMAIWGIAILLIFKQRSLDLREAKEIYTHFLAL